MKRIVASICRWACVALAFDTATSIEIADLASDSKIRAAARYVCGVGEATRVPAIGDRCNKDTDTSSILRHIFDRAAHLHMRAANSGVYNGNTLAILSSLAMGEMDICAIERTGCLSYLDLEFDGGKWGTTGQFMCAAVLDHCSKAEADSDHDYEYLVATRAPWAVLRSSSPHATMADEWRTALSKIHQRRAESAVGAESTAEAESAVQAGSIVQAESTAKADSIVQAESTAEAKSAVGAESIVQAESTAEAESAAGAESAVGAESTVQAGSTAEAESAVGAESIVQAEPTANAADATDQKSVLRIYVNGHANSDQYGIVEAGDTVGYRLKIVNTGDTCVQDLLLSDFGSNCNIPSGDFCPRDPALICSGTRPISQENIDESGLLVKTRVSALYPSDTRVTQEAEMLVKLEGITGVDVDVLASWADGDDSDGIPDVHENLSRTITVTNDGTVSLSHFCVEVLEPNQVPSDSTSNRRCLGCQTPALLAPLEYFKCTVHSEITQQDLDAAGRHTTDIAVTAQASSTVVQGFGVTILPLEQSPELSLGVQGKWKNSGLTNGHVDVGDMIAYNVTVVNMGTVTLHGLEVLDSSGLILECFRSRTVTSSPRYNNGSAYVFGIIAPGEHFQCLHQYEITREDIRSGGIMHTSEATAGSFGIYKEVVDWDFFMQGLPQVGAMAIDIEGRAESASNGTVEAGDVVEYTITIENTGDACLHGFQSSGFARNCIVPTEEFCPGDSALTCSGTHFISQENIDESGLLLQTRVSALDPLNAHVMLEAENLFELEGTPSLDVEMLAAWTDGAEGDRTPNVGEDIFSTFTVTNNGTVTLSNLCVVPLGQQARTSKIGSSTCLECETPSFLPPLEDFECTVHSQVTQEDLDAGGREAVDVAVTASTPMFTSVQGLGRTIVSLEQDPKLSLEIEGTWEDSGLINSRPDAGERITHRMTAINMGTVTLRDLRVSDSNGRLADCARSAPIVPASSAEKASSSGFIRPGEQYHCIHRHEISQDDIESAEAMHTFTATASTTVTKRNADAWDFWSEELPHEGDIAVDVYTRLMNGAQRGGESKDGYADEGAVVEYYLRVTNVGNVNLQDFELQGVPTDCRAWASLVPPGHEFRVKGSYYLTLEDIDSGLLEKTIAVTSHDMAGHEVSRDITALVTLKRRPPISDDDSRTWSSDSDEFSPIASDEGSYDDFGADVLWHRYRKHTKWVSALIVNVVIVAVIARQAIKLGRQENVVGVGEVNDRVRTGFQQITRNRGMENYNKWCFGLALVQVIMVTAEYRDIVLQYAETCTPATHASWWSFLLSARWTRIFGSSGGLCYTDRRDTVLVSLANLMKELDENNDRIADPTAFMKALFNFCAQGTGWVRDEHQCPSEALTYVLDALRSAVLEQNLLTDAVDKLSWTLMEERFVCCKVLQGYNELSVLKVPVARSFKLDLQTLLNETADGLIDYECDDCAGLDKKKCRGTYRATSYAMFQPRVLPIHLLRFDSTSEKVGSPVSFPLDGLLYGENPNMEMASGMYNLAAVILHQGSSMASGHVTALVRFSTDDPNSDWVHYGVSASTIVDRTYVEGDAVGQQAYMLFYRRSP